MKVKLDRCDCGNMPKILDHELKNEFTTQVRFKVACLKCHAGTAWYLQAKSAIDMWNKGYSTP